jgi:hypothetical protein
MNNKELKELKANEDNLKQIYQTSKPKCFGFMAKCFGHQSMTDTKMLTIYNDAFVVFYEKIDEQDFKLNCKIQVYLNSVCRNMALEGFREDKKMYKTTDKDIENLDYSDDITDVLVEPEYDNPYQKAIEKAFKIIREKGGNCAEILAMFWYQKASMKDIAKKFSYTNATNARVQKAKCQKRLKDIALQFQKE